MQQEIQAKNGHLGAARGAQRHQSGVFVAPKGQPWPTLARRWPVNTDGLPTGDILKIMFFKGSLVGVSILGSIQWKPHLALID